MDLLIVWEFRLGMIILCVSRVRLPAIVASCTFAVFAVQKVVLLIDEGTEGCVCLGSFAPAAALFSEGISPTALPVNLVLAVLLALRRRSLNGLRRCERLVIPGCGGILLYPAAAFQRVEGYDEMFVAYGCEDSDWAAFSW